jgi:Uma2 family endonuclease
MVMPALPRRRWSREEVLRLIEQEPLITPRYEVVDGELFVTPSPGGLHQAAVGRMYAALDAYCRAEQIGEAFLSPWDMELERGQLVQPDVFVVSPAEAKRVRRERPGREAMLTVEVLSSGSERGDRGRKRQLYQRRVAMYWIVSVEDRAVEQWLRGQRRATLLRERLEWHPVGSRQPFQLNLPRYFSQVYGEE